MNCASSDLVQNPAEPNKLHKHEREREREKERERERENGILFREYCNLQGPCSVFSF